MGKKIILVSTIWVNFKLIAKLEKITLIGESKILRIEDIKGTIYYFPINNVQRWEIKEYNG